MIKIIYEDDSILVIDKPAGLICIPDGYDRSIPYVRSLLEPEFGRLWIVHRIDKETSGILILARSAKVHQLLNDQFSNREVHKTYSALIFGTFPQSLSVELSLKINGDRRHRTVVDKVNGKEAKTDFNCAENYQNDSSLISIYPHTGYTHQIRSHLLFSGFPILSDPLYYTNESKSFSANLPIHRTALHAHQIRFQHPVTQEMIEFTAEIPIDFIETIDYLKKRTEHPN
jgi:tRNA pseudouridine32 synthase / 23S rRNA pseudouridine746 synthase